MNLQSYIFEAYPDGLRYNEAAQLCIRLYCTVDGVPEELQSECSKDVLAEVFSQLAAAGFITNDATESAIYGANFHDMQDKGHWIEVIASNFKKGDTRDMELGELLVNRLTSK